MKWLLALLNLLPVIAQGITIIHTDATLGSKQQLAQDSLNLAIQGAKAVAPAEEQPLIDAVSPIAQQTLATTVALMHNAATAAPAAAAAPAQVAA